MKFLVKVIIGITLVGNIVYGGHVDSLNVKLVGYCSIPYSPCGVGVTVAGSYAYFAWDTALIVIDVSNPYSPQEVGICPLPDYFPGKDNKTETSKGVVTNDIAVVGSYAYFADVMWDNWNGLRIIDISNPTSPYEVGACSTCGSPWDIRIQGSYAYTASYTNWGLVILDISNPYSPQMVGNCGTPYYTISVAVSGSYAYLGDAYCRFYVIDISTPTSPQDVSYCSIGTCPYAIVTAGSYAYLANGSHGLGVVDISNPTSPQVAGACSSWTQPHFARDVVVSGSYAYIADMYHGLRIIDISNPSSPQEVGYYDTYFDGIDSEPWDVVVVGPYVYIADRVNGLYIYENLLVAGAPDIGVTPDTVQFCGDNIDTLHQDWEDIILDPWSAEYRVEYEASKLTPAQPCSIITIGHGVISPTAGASKQCSVFVWSDDAGSPGTVLAKAIMNISAVNADSLYFNWYNINPPVYVTGPFWVGNYEMDTLLPTTVIDYVPTTDATKYSLNGSTWEDDAVDYLHSVVVNYGGASSDIVKTMTVKNDGGATLNVSNITKDQSWIISVAPTSFSIPAHSSQDVTVIVNPAGLGNGIYYGTLTISSDDADENPYSEPVKLVVGTVGVEERESSEFRVQSSEFKIYPNPFTTRVRIQWSGISEKQKIRLQIYNLGGRLVKTLVPTFQSLITGVTWDGKDNSGKEVPAGIYFCKIEAGKFKETKKLTIIR